MEQRIAGMVADFRGVMGIAAELLLIGHFDDPFQFVPLVLLGCATPLLLGLAIAPTRASIVVTRLVMALFVASGGVGVALHYRGNEAFELEMYPALAGRELVVGTLTGSTPVLAPGSMSLLGFLGLAIVHRHPAAESGTQRAGTQEE